MRKMLCEIDLEKARGIRGDTLSPARRDRESIVEGGLRRRLRVDLDTNPGEDGTGVPAGLQNR